MNRKQKQETVDRILDLLMQLIEEEHPQTGRSKPVEMITIKEAVSTIQGISEHTIRMLVAQNVSITSAPARENVEKFSSARNLCWNISALSLNRSTILTTIAYPENSFLTLK